MEAMGPGGSSIIIDIETSKPARARQEILKIMKVRGLSPGAVQYKFHKSACIYCNLKKGSLLLSVENDMDENLMDVALNIGATDYLILQHPKIAGINALFFKNLNFFIL